MTAQQMAEQTAAKFNAGRTDAGATPAKGMEDTERTTYITTHLHLDGQVVASKVQKIVGDTVLEAVNGE